MRVLLPILLALATAAHATDISGTITTTTWTKAGSPYTVTGTVTVPAGEKLTIEAGVRVVFGSRAELVVDGELLSAGNADAPIAFRGAWPGSWDGVTLRGSSVHMLMHTEIEGSAMGGVAVTGGSAHLISCLVRDNEYVTQRYEYQSEPLAVGGGIAVLRGGSITIDQCTIRDNVVSATAIMGGIYGVVDLGLGGGVYVDSRSSATITNSYLLRDYANYAGSAVYSVGRTTVSNCTLVGNRVERAQGSAGLPPLLGGPVGDDDGVSLESCIIWDLSPAELGAGGDPSTRWPVENVAWSNVQSRDGIPLAGTGNISADPLFADSANGNYRLLPGSPCIDAGDPDARVDADGSRADIGARTPSGGPVAMVTPALLYVSSTRSDTMFVRNLGDEPLVVHAIHLPGDFASNAAVPFVVPPGGTEAIGVTFAGSRNWTSGACSVNHSGETGTTSITLSGVVGTVLGSERLPRTLSAVMSPYHVLSSFHLPAGDTLALEPGVRLRFVTSDSMFVEGVVTADGTASRPCAIEGASWNWAGISVSGAGSVELSHTTIEGGRHRTHGGGMRITSGGSATLRNCTIRDNHIAADAYYPTGGGVYVGGEGTTATFLNCTIEDNGARYWNHHGGWITVRGSGGGILVTNGASALLRGCWIRANMAGLGGSALTASNADLLLEYCLLTENIVDAGATEWRVEPTTVHVRDTRLAVRNCTIARNIYDRGDWAAIRAAGSSTVEISNTVVWEVSDRGAGLELALYDESVAGTVITYSDFALPRTGAGNISTDPLFVDPANGDFRLQPGSPCVDAGDPAQLDPDGSRSDIGAIPFGEEWPPTRVDETMLPTRLTLHQNRPNPFNPLTHIDFVLFGEAEARLTVYDVTGRAVRTLVDDALGAGEHDVVWDGNDDAGRPCASGLYVYRLTTPGGTVSRRMTLLR